MDAIQDREKTGTIPGFGSRCIDITYSVVSSELDQKEIEPRTDGKDAVRSNLSRDHVSTQHAESKVTTMEATNSEWKVIRVSEGGDGGQAAGASGNPNGPYRSGVDKFKHSCSRIISSSICYFCCLPGGLRRNGSLESREEWESQALQYNFMTW